MAIRIVKPGEAAPAPTAPKSIVDAAAGGSTYEVLVAMRARVAKTVQDENTPARDLAALTKRLIEIIRDIEAIDARRAEDDHNGSPAAEDATFDASAV